MLLPIGTFFVFLFLVAVESQDNNNDAVNNVVNFAYGGSMTDENNRFLFCVAPLNCTRQEERQGVFDEVGAIAPGLASQISFATITLSVINRDTDLFLVSGGGNDYFGPPPGWPFPRPFIRGYGGMNKEYDFQTAAWSVKNLALFLEDIYETFGAKYIVIPNIIDPCDLPDCDTDNLEELGLGFLVRAGIRIYSGIFARQMSRGIERVVDDFNRNHEDATAIFIDARSFIKEQLESGDFIVRPTCFDALAEEEDDPNSWQNDDGIGTNCTNYAWLDDGHLTSEFQETVARELYAVVIEDEGLSSNINRIIAFGDSILDNGSFYAERVKSGYLSPIDSPPYVVKGRTNRNTLSEWIEIALDLDIRAEPYLNE